MGSILPLDVHLASPISYGTWLMGIYGHTQHAGLAENVLDHRLNCRTVYMNPINRFLYWNMNYHLEHHMFPLVPYHALPRDSTRHGQGRLPRALPQPPGRPGGKSFPALLRQVKDPAYYVKRKLPEPEEPIGWPGRPVLVERSPSRTSRWMDRGLLRRPSLGP